MKLGIALSVYNKIDELATNINIIRKHWKSQNDAFISVCCNDPNSIDIVRSLDVNFVIQGDDIPSIPKSSLRCRQFDCIKKSMEGCNANYIFHWHADAYALDPDELIKIIRYMEQNDVRASFRGKGLNWQD